MGKAVEPQQPSLGRNRLREHEDQPGGGCVVQGEVTEQGRGRFGVRERVWILFYECNV